MISMKIAGRTDCKITANIYTHVRDETLKKATVNLEEVLGVDEVIAKDPGKCPVFFVFVTLHDWPECGTILLNNPKYATALTVKHICSHAFQKQPAYNRTCWSRQISERSSALRRIPQLNRCFSRCCNLWPPGHPKHIRSREAKPL